MIELAYQNSSVNDIYYTVYKFNKSLFKKIERLIGLSPEHERFFYDNQIGVYRRTLIFILQNIPKCLLENITILVYSQGPTYAKMTGLISEIENLQLYCDNTFLFENTNNQQLESKLNQINLYLDKCMYYYDILHEYWKQVSMNKFKMALLRELPTIMEYNDYNYYRNLLLSIGDDFDKLESAIDYGRNIVIEDWQHQLTNLNEFCDGIPFSFLVHTGYDSNVTQNFVSSTLITDRLWTTYHDLNVGFIMDPKDIVAAYSKDVYTDNYALDKEYILPRMPVPTIHTKKYLEDECLKIQETTGFVMSEIVTQGFNPLGIICIYPIEDDYGVKVRRLKSDLLRMKEIFPNLPVITVNQKSYVKQMIKQ